MSGKLQDLITLPRSWCPAKTMKEVKNNPIGKRKKRKQQRNYSSCTEMLKSVFMCPV